MITKLTTANYLYVDPGLGSINFGDRVIDVATRQMMAGAFPEPRGFAGSHESGVPDGEWSFVIVPGVTMLTDGTRRLLDHDTWPTCPVYCLAGNLWSALPRPGFLVRSRVIGRGRVPVSTRIASRLAQPVGARDPFTHQALRNANIESIYTGCPTLLLNAEGVADDGFVLFSFGRHHVRSQVAAAHRLARKHQLIGICHEVNDESRIRAAGFRPPLATFRGDIVAYLSYFKRASVVVTGRLHGALPALAYGKRVFYFGTRDSRTTILDDIGVPIHDYSDLRRATDKASETFNRHFASSFRQRWCDLLGLIADRHGLA